MIQNLAENKNLTLQDNEVKNYTETIQQKPT